jgi:23S rRNA (pseudouridine1915-N3)-methyltransferase
MPDWVDAGYQEYAQRLGRDCALSLKTLPTSRKSQRQSSGEVIRQDGARLLAAVPAGSHVVALDEAGSNLNSAKFARRLQVWMDSYRDVSLLVGGADGLSDECRKHARESWSLSALTFPHGLVRVIVAEQIYRACSLLNNHPYHRA